MSLAWAIAKRDLFLLPSWAKIIFHFCLSFENGQKIAVYKHVELQWGRDDHSSSWLHDNGSKRPSTLTFFHIFIDVPRPFSLTLANSPWQFYFYSFHFYFVYMNAVTWHSTAAKFDLLSIFPDVRFYAEKHKQVPGIGRREWKGLFTRSVILLRRSAIDFHKAESWIRIKNKKRGPLSEWVNRFPHNITQGTAWFASRTRNIPWFCLFYFPGERKCILERLK